MQPKVTINRYTLATEDNQYKFCCEGLPVHFQAAT